MGWEVLVDEKTWGNYLFAACSPLFHSNYNHLISNLPYFIIIGTLVETWWMQKTKLRNSLILYFFLFLPSISGVIGYFCSGRFSIGLSGIIIMLDMILIVYIFRCRTGKMWSEIDVIVALLVGLVFTSLFGWLHGTLQPYIDEWTKDEIIGHLLYALLGIAIGFLIYCSSRNDT